MSILFKMAWLNIWRNKRRAAILLCAMCAGLAGVIVLMGVTEGWIDEMLESAVRTQEGHVKIMGSGFNDNPVIENCMSTELLGKVYDRLDSDHRVAAWAERVVVQGLLSTPRHSRIISITGIDPSREKDVSIIRSAVVEGSFLSEDEPNRILIGQKLSDKLQKGLGKKAVLMSQQVGGELGSSAMRISGIFNTGNGSFDENTVFILKSDARQMLNLSNQVTETVVLLNDIDDSEAVAAELAPLAPQGVDILTWKQRLPFIVETLDMTNRYMIPFYAIFYIAMAFGIVNTLLMAIGERTHEIGVMLAIGMTRMRLVKIVMLESFFISLIAVVVGCAVGVGIVTWYGQHGIDLTAFASGLEYLGVGKILYLRISAAGVGWAAAATVAISLLFSIYPAAKAARLVPVEAIRTIG
ncbi:MAG: ABC transporter permease [Verrucomicrobia bacterium]|nr:ABC transporter permease [Verrucomicrobiota bacterium]